MWMPLALWGLHRTLDTGRIRHGLATGAAVACQAWSCLYYAIFFAPYLALVGTVLLAGRGLTGRVAAWRSAVTSTTTAAIGRILVALTAGALLAALLTAPLVQPYTASRAVVGERSMEEIGGASLRDYLAAPPSNRLYGPHTARFGGAERFLFPGVAVAVLALIGFWPPWSPTRVAYAAGLLLAFDVSRGSNGFSQPLLFELFPPFRALRAVSRMGLLAAMTLTILAGLGAASLLTWERGKGIGDRGIGSALRGDRRREWLVAAAVIVLLAESASAPLDLQRVPRNPPEVSRWLATRPPTAVLELPLGVQDTLLMYFSIWHWQRLANGYSGFFPHSYTRLTHLLRQFPDDASISEVKARGIQLIVVHENLMRDGEYRRITDALARRNDVRPVATFGFRGTEARVYAVSENSGVRP
jgi:hypothetical protein